MFKLYCPITFHCFVSGSVSGLFIGNRCLLWLFQFLYGTTPAPTHDPTLLNPSYAARR